MKKKFISLYLLIFSNVTPKKDFKNWIHKQNLTVNSSNYINRRHLKEFSMNLIEIRRFALEILKVKSFCDGIWLFSFTLMNLPKLSVLFYVLKNCP